MVRPKFCSVNTREICAIASSSSSDFSVIRYSNRWTSSDLLRAKLSKVSTNDINTISGAYQRSQTPIAPDQGNLSAERFAYKKRRRSEHPNAALRNCGWSILEGEIHPGPHHAEVVLRTVNKVPTEITDPADVRRKANFEAATDLANCLGLGVGVKIRQNVRVFTVRKRIPFTTAKDRTASAKNVRRKARAVEGITQGQRAQDRTHRARVMAAREEEKLLAGLLVLKFREILDASSGTHRPTFDTNTEVTVEEVFEIRTTAPRMIGLEVAIIFPSVSRKQVSAPKAHVKLIIRVPLRTRRRKRHLFHLLSRICFSSGKRDGGDRTDAQQSQH